MTGSGTLRVSLRRWRLRRCDAPCLGPTAEAFSPKPDIMRGSRGAARITGEQSTGLENVLQSGSQLWSTPRRLRSRTSVKARTWRRQLWPPKTLDCWNKPTAPRQKKMGTPVLRRRPLAALSRVPATPRLRPRPPLRLQRLSNHELMGIRLPSCTWICTTLTRRLQREAAMC